MPGNFDEVMAINGHGCLTPSGPLGLVAGETALRLDIWIYQVRAACIGSLLAPEGVKWEMNPDPHSNHFGVGFRPGAAVGMGLMVKKNSLGQEVVEQWSTPINLVDK